MVSIQMLLVVVVVVGHFDMLIDHSQVSFHRTSIEPKTNHDSSLAMPSCSHTKRYSCSEEVCFNMSCCGGRMPNVATANVITGSKVRRMPRSRSWETRGPTSCILCERKGRGTHRALGGGTRGHPPWETWASIL